MFNLLLLILGLSVLAPDVEAAPSESAPESASGLETTAGTQRIRRPRYGNYNRRRRLRVATRKAKKNEKRKSRRRKGVITVDRPIRN